MKKFVFILFIVLLSACSNNNTVVQFPEGDKVLVKNPDRLYELGDTVCVAGFRISSSLSETIEFSTVYWKDTIVLTNFGDSSYAISEYRMGRIIEER
jgi:hypothetical protein